MAFLAGDLNHEQSLIDVQREQDVNKALRKQLNTEKQCMQLAALLAHHNVSLARDKLFQVRVKVFKCLQDLMRTHPECVNCANISLLTAKDVNFFVIEVFVARAVREHLLDLNSIDSSAQLQFAIADNTSKVFQNVPLQNCANCPITSVLTFKKTPLNNECVTVELRTKWRLVVARVYTNVSYKFFTPKPTSNLSSLDSLDEDILNINSLYVKDFFGEQKQSYTLTVWAQREDFIAKLVRNAYHNLNPAALHVQIADKGSLSVDIEINERRVRLAFAESGKKCLRIEAHDDVSGEQLVQLKRFFGNVEEGTIVRKKDFAHIYSVNALKNVRKQLLDELKGNRPNVHNLLNSYDVYSRFIDSSPL